MSGEELRLIVTGSFLCAVHTDLYAEQVPLQQLEYLNDIGLLDVIGNPA